MSKTKAFLSKMVEMNGTPSENVEAIGKSIVVMIDEICSMDKDRKILPSECSAHQGIIQMLALSMAVNGHGGCLRRLVDNIPSEIERMMRVALEETGNAEDCEAAVAQFHEDWGSAEDIIGDGDTLH